MTGNDELWLYAMLMLGGGMPPVGRLIFGAAAMVVWAICLAKGIVLP